MGRKSRIEQSPFAIKDVLVSNSGNNIKYNNLMKKENTCEISLTLFHILKNRSVREQKCKYKTIQYVVETYITMLVSDPCYICW